MMRLPFIFLISYVIAYVLFNLFNPTYLSFYSKKSYYGTITTLAIVITFFIIFLYVIGKQNNNDKR